MGACSSKTVGKMCKTIFSFLKRLLLLCGRRSYDANFPEVDIKQEAPLLQEQGRLFEVTGLYPQHPEDVVNKPHHCIDIHIYAAESDHDKPGESLPDFPPVELPGGKEPHFSSVELILEKEDEKEAVEDKDDINGAQPGVFSLIAVELEDNRVGDDAIIVDAESLKSCTSYTHTLADFADLASITSSSVDKNENGDGQADNTDCRSQKPVAVGMNEKREIRSLGHYNNTQKILLVGEGDFSFSAGLAKAFGNSADNMFATSLNSLEFLMENYARADENLTQLALAGCTVFHDVDATTMAASFLGYCLFDRIVFNFPHTGFPRRRKSREIQIRSNQELVKGFLANAREMINEDGEIHITHKCNSFHIEWRIAKLARSQGLRLLEQVPFRLDDYPGYETKYGFGGDKNFDCNPSRTYKFVLRERLKVLKSKGHEAMN